MKQKISQIVEKINSAQLSSCTCRLPLLCFLIMQETLLIMNFISLIHPGV